MREGVVTKDDGDCMYISVDGLNPESVDLSSMQSALGKKPLNIELGDLVMIGTPVEYLLKQHIKAAKLGKEPFVMSALLCFTIKYSEFMTTKYSERADDEDRFNLKSLVLRAFICAVDIKHAADGARVHIQCLHRERPTLMTIETDELRRCGMRYATTKCEISNLVDDDLNCC